MPQPDRGKKVVERLGRDEVKRVAWLLELAVAGRVSQRTLAGAITRASRRSSATAAQRGRGTVLIRAEAPGLRANMCS